MGDESLHLPSECDSRFCIIVIYSLICASYKTILPGRIINMILWLIVLFHWLHVLHFMVEMSDFLKTTMYFYGFPTSPPETSRVKKYYHKGFLNFL